MGRSRATHAGRALMEKQDRFIRLIAHGVSNREACRLVGINRRTGTRWRLGRTISNTAGEAVHYPPVHIAAPPKRHPRYLSLDERMVIGDLRWEHAPELHKSLGEINYGLLGLRLYCLVTCPPIHGVTNGGCGSRQGIAKVAGRL